jgi:hypothetical protein
MYDAKQGRFLTEDPLGIEAGDSNFYRYVVNNPATKIDPSGLEEQPSPPRAARELAGAIQRRDVAQLYALYAASKRGFLYGVFVDGGWGTVTSLPEMAWEAVEWNRWLREAQYAALTDPLGFARRRREELDRTRTVVDQVRELTPDELRRLMTGDTSGLEGKVDADLLEISGALGEALNDLQRHLTEELSAEDAAYAMGRIYGAVAFEVTLTAATGGVAAALKAGKLARTVGRLRKIRGLNTPTGERLLKRLTDAAEAVHESVKKSARGETPGSGLGGLGDLGAGKRPEVERGGVAPSNTPPPRTPYTAKNPPSWLKSLTGTKPAQSPDPVKWANKGGSISQKADGTWVYHDWEGHSVAYAGGHPDFEGAGLVKFKAPVKQKPDYYFDYKEADRQLGRSYDPKTERWHHHEGGEHMMLIDKKLHNRFTHEGGIAAGDSE